MVGGFSFSTTMTSSSSPSPLSFPSLSSSSLPTNPNPFFGSSSPSFSFCTSTTTAPSLFGSGSGFGTPSSSKQKSNSNSTAFSMNTNVTTPAFSFSPTPSTAAAAATRLSFENVTASSSASLKADSTASTTITTSFLGTTTANASAASTPPFPAFGSSSMSTATNTNVTTPAFLLWSTPSTAAATRLSFENVTASSGLQSSASLKADSTASTPAFSAISATSSAATTTTTTTSTQAVTGSVPSTTNPATSTATTSSLLFQTSAKTSGFFTPASQPQSTAATSFLDSTAGTTTANASAASTPSFSASGVTSSTSTAAASTPAFSAFDVMSSADTTTTKTPGCTAFGVTSSVTTTTAPSSQAVTGIGLTLSASTTTASTPTGSVPSTTSPATSTGTTSSFLGFQTSAKTPGSLTPASQPQSTAATSFLGNRRSINFTSMKSNRGSPCCGAGPISIISTSENNNNNNQNKHKNKKQVWIWTENKEVMTSAVERGWSTFIFSSIHRHTATDWSSIALISPLIIEDNKLFDEEARLVATISEISSPQQLEQLQPVSDHAENVIVDLLDWQVIPAENIVAAFHGSHKTVFAVSKSPSEAQVFLEALEQGLGGVVLKTQNVEDVLELKGYFDRKNEEDSLLELTKATITGVQMTGMGDRVCVDLCSLMRPGEGLLVGSFARGLFLVHSECLESNYIASRPFRVNAGPVHAYVAVPGGKTCYLSELKTGEEVLVVDQNGIQRTAVVGRVKIETRPLVIVDAMVEETCYSILLQNAETVGLVSPKEGNGGKVIPVTSLKVGDEVLLRLQGDARHTGIEIQEFIVEK
uniref:putative GPI-anchored protein pfl2 isoform X2 n=1 Tax=Erigeron canadensis TaxID=72917 RepID=UPI001CB94A3F|nr:putative GPI-anchored protein pfl2 isoform X2 [Erigeron canadensis]